MNQKTDCIPAYRRRKDHRPAEILAAGLEEFHEHGFARASLGRIAERAGVSRATLYRYFENKDALFLATANAAMTEFTSDAVVQIEMDEGDTEALMRAILTRLYGVLASKRGTTFLRIMVAEGADLPGIAARYHTEVMQRGEQLLERIIQRGIARGELREGPYTQIPQLLIAPTMFFAVHRLIIADLEPLDAEAFAQGHLDILMRGIAL